MTTLIALSVLYVLAGLLLAAWVAGGGNVRYSPVSLDSRTP